jgi:hypothetical protein
MDTGWKRYTFYINSTAHADMRIKLRHDEVPQQTFFKMLIKAYIEDNTHMRELIKELNAEKLGKRSLKKMKKDEKLATEQEEWFGLSEEEITDIYDQIEMDDNNE